MKKRALASLLSLCLLVGLLPTAALAVEEPGSDPSPVCNCAAFCTEEDINEACEVCKADHTACAYTELAPPDDGGSEFTPCTVTEGCTLSDGHEGECVLSDSELDGTNAVLLSDDNMSGTCGAEGNEGNVTWKLEQNNEDSENTTYTLNISGTGAMADYSKASEQPWYSIKDKIEKVVIEESVIHVGNHAFDQVYAKTFVLPASLTSIGNWGIASKNAEFVLSENNTNFVLDAYGALYDVEMTTLYAYPGSKEAVGIYNVPDGVITVSGGAFVGAKIRKIVFPDSMEILGTWQSPSNELNEVVFGAGIKNIETGAFARASALVTVTFPETVKDLAIGDQAFMNTGVTSITLPSGIQSVGAKAFESAKLTSVVFLSTSSGLTIGDQAFRSNALTTVTLPEGIVSIGSQAFADQSSLAAVTFPQKADGLVIGSYAFRQTGLTKITLPEGIKEIGRYAFGNLTTLSAVTFPETVHEDGLTIGEYAFDATSLVDVILPANVAGLSQYSFRNISTLKAFTWNGPAKTGAVIDKFAILTNSSLEKLMIPEGVTKINEQGIAQLAGLKFVSLPSTIETINKSGLHVLNALEVIDASKVKGSADLTSGWLNAKPKIVYFSSQILANTISGWVPTARAVTNGGTFPEDTEFASDTLATPTKDGFIFDGWFTKGGADNDWGDKLNSSPTAKSTYYAKWIELTTQDISMEYDSEKNLSEITIGGVSLSNWTSANSDVAKIESGKLIATGVGKTTITADASLTRSGEKLTVNVEVTPMRIIYGKTDTTQNDAGIGRPYITYALNDDGTAPTFNDLLGFYPVKAGSQNGTFEADTSKDKIDLKPGVGDDGDVYYVYQNDVSGNIIQTDTLPTHPTTDAEGAPHSIRVELKLKNPNYAFYTVGTNWAPGDTIILYVTCYESGMNEVDLYLEGDTTPLETFEGDREFEYTGEGIVPTSRDLTTLYTKGTNTEYSITSFTVHFHAVQEDAAFSGTHLRNQTNSQLTADALKAIAPTELGVYSFVINGYNKDTKTYCYASRRYSIVKGNPNGTPSFTTVNSGVKLSEVVLTGTMKNAAGIEIPGIFTWENGEQTVTRGTSYKWIFTPNDTNHYNEATGTAVVWPGSSGGGGGSSSTTYTVSTEKASHGTVQVNPTRAQRSDIVTITVKPDSGYELDELTVTDKNGDAVKFTDKGNGKYTFTMPASKVTVTASFVEIEETLSINFTDVPTDAYYADAVAWAVKQGITKGTSETTFSPDTSCTRAQMATFLWRAAGSPAPKRSEMTFTDIPADAYYYDAVLWAVENGITNGVGNNGFAPDAVCTRSQMATFLYRFEGTPAITGGNPFGDVASDAYYAAAVTWAVAEGITVGTGSNLFSPDADCTRGQMVTFLYRYLAN